MPTLPTTANLALWLDATQPAYSDAGVTLAVAPYGRVKQIAQPAPLTGNWTAPNDNARPFLEVGALDLHRGNPTTLNAPAATISANNCTFACAWHHRVGQGLFSPFFVPTPGAPFSLYTSGALYLSTPSGYAPVAGLPSPLVAAGHLTAKCTLILTCTPTQYELRLTVNGASYTAIVAIAPVSGALGTVQICPPFVIGSSPGTQHALSQFVAYSAALNSAQQDALQTFLLANMPPDPPVTAPLVIMAGDSICAAWSPLWQSAFDGFANPPRLINLGVAGSHTSIPGEQDSFFTTDALPYYSASRSKNIFLMEGISINDLAFRLGSGDTPAVAAASVLAGYYAYLDHARATMPLAIIIACTLSPNLAGAPYDTARAIINADIRANYAAHANYLCDLGAAPGLSTTADAANTTYSYDGTHLTEAGYLNCWNPVLIPVLTAALADVVPPTPPAGSARVLTIEKQYDGFADPTIYVFSLLNSGASNVVAPSVPDMAITLTDGSYVTLTDGSYATTA